MVSESQVKTQLPPAMCGPRPPAQLCSGERSWLVWAGELGFFKC